MGVVANICLENIIFCSVKAIADRTFLEKIFESCSLQGEFHAVLTQVATVESEGRLKFPAAVSSAAPDDIHLVHWLRTLHLKWWLRETSSGCRTEVRPPGITIT